MSTQNSNLYVWAEDDIPTQTQMAQYLTNVEEIRSAVIALPTTPPTPKSMENLNYEQANNIEKILLAAENALTRLDISKIYSAEFYAAEV